MYKSIKNIFLGIIFLCVFLIPATHINAAYDVKGDTSKTINNVSTGSWYNAEEQFDPETGISMGFEVSDQGNGKKGNTNLYNKNQNVTELETKQFQALLIKLEAGKSNVNTKKLTAYNTYVVNTPSASVYITKGDDGKDYIIAVATDNDSLYIPKNPVPKEGKVSVDSLDPTTGNGLLNLIDRDRGIPIGTTVNAKNDFYNKTQDDNLAQDKLAEANSDLAAAQQALFDFKKTREYTQGTYDPAKLAELEKNLAAAQAAQAQAATNATNAADALRQAELQRQMSGVDPTAKCSTVLSMFTFNCMLWLAAKGTNIIFKLMSFITYIVGVLFDYSLELSINSAEFFKKLGVIEAAWTFLRDILNITFIFILLWAAIQLLIGNEAQYNAKKVLMNVVIVAILINFSLFAAKIMVDGSNIVSLKIYETMKASSAENPTASISARVMGVVGLSALYNITQIFSDRSVQAYNACVNNPGALITVSVLGSIFLAILCLALGLAAVLFLVRLVNIIVLFIKSPLWVWGYVLPNNPSVSKFKDSWWAEMKHVLTFPIAYLFWMLVAIIIFEKLGEGSKGTSFLQIICQPPAAGTGGMSTETISVFAVFVIVIIFMMRAISYGVKHAAGTGETIGGKWSQSVANKFGSWQDAATKGLAKKTWEKSSSAAAGVGIGAAKLTSSGISGLAGGTLSKIRGKTFREGFDGGAAITTKEGLRDLARSIAANNSNNWLGSKAAKFADKYKDPTNSAGKTRMDLDKQRTLKAKEDEERIQNAIDAKYKASSQKDWEKTAADKIAEGAKVGKTPAELYKDYLTELASSRIDATLGIKGAHKIVGKDGKTHLETLMEKSVQEVKDEHGNLTGYKMREGAMYNAIQDAIKFHTEGDGAKSGADMTDGKKRLGIHMNKKAAARIKAAGDIIKKKESEAMTKDIDKDEAERQIEKIRKQIDYVEKLPDLKTIESSFTSGSVYTGHGDNEKIIRELNKAYDKTTDPAIARDPIRLADAEQKLKDKKNEYTKFLDKAKDSLIKQRSNLANKINKQAEAETNKDKK